MDAELQYLLGYLEEEFGADSRFAVKLTPTVVSRRSPDLPPLDEPLPPQPQGVVVKSPRREYFFPVDWVRARRYSEIELQVTKIRDE